MSAINMKYKPHFENFISTEECKISYKIIIWIALWEKFDSWEKGNLDTEGRLWGYTKKTLCGDGGLECCIHKPRNTCGYQKLEERRGTDSSLVPSEGAWPHQFPDVVLLASRTETINLCRFKPIQGEKGSGGSNSCYPAHRDGRPGVLWDSH